jgi:hypothetical protein
MTQQIINIGSAANDGTGDPLRTSFVKTNANFTELYAYAAPLDALAYNGIQVNGSFDVSQEKAGSGTTANGGYPCDNWRLYFVGTMAITAAKTGLLIAGFPASLGLSVQTAQVSLGASDVAQIYQSIEGYRVARLAWGTANAQPITLGFWTSHHRPGLYSGTVLNSASNRCYAFTYTQSAADVGQYNVVTIPGDTAGVWATDNTVGMNVVFALAAGSSATAPSANTWLAANYSAAPGQVNAVAATSDAFRITGVVVLPGIEAPSAARSAFIMRPFDQELVTCKRYWESSWNYGVIPGGWTAGLDQLVFAHSSGSFSQVVPYVQKRAVPTVTIFDNVGAANKVAYYAAGWASGGAISGGAFAKDKFAFVQHGIAGSIFTNFAYTADARL